MSKKKQFIAEIRAGVEVAVEENRAERKRLAAEMRSVLKRIAEFHDQDPAGYLAHVLMMVEGTFPECPGEAINRLETDRVFRVEDLLAVASDGVWYFIVRGEQHPAVADACSALRD
jgi:hypothetical protein